MRSDRSHRRHGGLVKAVTYVHPPDGNSPQGSAHQPLSAPITPLPRIRATGAARQRHAILPVMQIRRRTYVIIWALLAVATLGTVVFRKRLESAAGASGQAVADEARAVLMKRDDEQLQNAFATTRVAMAEARAITLY